MFRVKVELNCECSLIKQTAMMQTDTEAVEQPTCNSRWLNAPNAHKTPVFGAFLQGRLPKHRQHLVSFPFRSAFAYCSLLFSTARLPDVINWPALKVFSILNLGLRHGTLVVVEWFRSDFWISTFSFGITENGDISDENTFYNCLNELHCKLVDAIDGPLTEEFLINFRCAVDQVEQHGRQLANVNTEMKPTVDKHIQLVRESLKQAELVYEKTNQRHADPRSEDSMLILKGLRCWLKNVERQLDIFNKKLLSHCDDYDTLVAERKEFQEFFCQFIEEGALMFRDARRQLLQSVEISSINRRLFDCLKSRWLAMRLRCVERDCLYENALKRFEMEGMSSSVASSLYELEPESKKCRNDSLDAGGQSRDLLALSEGIFFEDEVDVGYSSGTSARSHPTSSSAGVDHPTSHDVQVNFSQTWPRQANNKRSSAFSKPPLHHVISKSTPTLTLLHREQQRRVPLRNSVNLMSADVWKIHHNIQNCCTPDVDENSKFSACLCLACQQHGDGAGLSNSLPTDQWMLSVDAEFESDVDDENHSNFEESIFLNKQARLFQRCRQQRPCTASHHIKQGYVSNDFNRCEKTTTLSSNSPQCWKKQHRQVAQCHPFESVGAKQCLLDDDESVMTDTTHQRVVVSKAFSEEEKFQAFVAQLSVLLFRAKSLLHTSSNGDASPSANSAEPQLLLLIIIVELQKLMKRAFSTLERSDDDVSKVTNSLRDWQLAFFEFVRRSTGSRDAVESMLVELVRLVSYLKQLIVLVQSNEETLCNEEISKLKAFNSNALQTMLTEAQKMREECGFDVANGKVDFNFDENQAYSYSSFADSPFGPADQPNDDAALVDRGGIQWLTSALCSNWQLPICLALLTCLVIYVLEPPECCSYRNVWERSLALQMHYVGDGIPPT
ncbi:Telomere-binding protein cav [Trichinella spiralis]|uniref:Telomere-binding protein cav n=1 Tax=Trichinella spiralis TaxID=6334 RepID=A0ABR3KE13_TRISP